MSQQESFCQYHSVWAGTVAEKSSWDRQTNGKNSVWFGEIERKLAKLSMTPLLTVLPLNYFMIATQITDWLLVRRKLLLTHWFSHVIRTERRVRSDKPVQYLKNRSYTHNLRLTPAQDYWALRSISLKIRPLGRDRVLQCHTMLVILAERPLLCSTPAGQASVPYRVERQAWKKSRQKS